MSNELKTFMGRDAQTHISSFGNVNHFSNKPNPQAVWAVYPDAVIVDGTDDWFAKAELRPQMLVEKAGVVPLAWFHSGISGITKSGLVLTRADFNKLAAFYLNTFGKGIAEFLTIYEAQ